MWGAYTEGLGKFGKHAYIPSITALVKNYSKLFMCHLELNSMPTLGNSPYNSP